MASFIDEGDRKENEEKKDEEWRESYTNKLSLQGNCYSFFKQSFYTNYRNGALIISYALCMLPMYVAIMVDMCIAAFTCDILSSSFPIATAVGYFTATIGVAIGLIIIHVPALLYSAYETVTRPSGEEIFARLEKLDQLLEENKEAEAKEIIERIHKNYKGDFDYPKALFSKDQNSEELYAKLTNNSLSILEKALAIAEFMETKNGNAGKEMYHIIFEGLNYQPTVYTFSYLDFPSDPLMYWTPF